MINKFVRLLKKKKNQLSDAYKPINFVRRGVKASNFIELQCFVVSFLYYLFGKFATE